MKIRNTEKKHALVRLAALDSVLKRGPPTQVKNTVMHRNYSILNTKSKVMIENNTNLKIHGYSCYTICLPPPSHNRVPFNYSANVLFVSKCWRTYGTFQL